MGLKNVKYIKYVLLASGITLSGCATTLEHRTPVDIASNSVQIKYPGSGVSEILAPPVKTFTELRAKVKGMAQLRTAGPFTDAKGVVYEGGAYLDILINYNSATPNPLETRQYSQARWPDGEIAQLADFGASVLDCRADIRNVRRYPFRNGYSGSGYYGAGYGYGYGNTGRRHHSRRDRHDRRDDHDQNDHTDHNYNHTDHTNHDRDRDHTGTDGTRIGASVARPVRPPKPPRRAHPTNDPAPQPDGPGTEPSIDPYFNPGTHPYSGSGANSGRAHQARQPHTASGASTRTMPSSAHRPSTRRTQPQTQQHRTSRPKRNTVKPRLHRPKSNNNNNNNSSIKHKSSTKHKSSRSHRSGRHLNYYPTDPFYNPGYIDTVVRRYCARQENLRVFVPRERLDAAKYSGITLLIRPRGGREEVLSLPPNYIAGFMLAAWTPEGRNMTIPGYPLPSTALEPKEQPPKRYSKKHWLHDPLQNNKTPKNQTPKNQTSENRAFMVKTRP